MGESNKAYPIEEALRAQNALRQLAGLGPELFPIQAFVGMVSKEIAAVIRKNSAIQITASDIAGNYAEPDFRRHSE